MRVVVIDVESTGKERSRDQFVVLCKYIEALPPHPKRKLTAEEVLAIRASTESLNALALRYGIWKRAIQLIKNGVTYRDVTNPNKRDA